MRTIQALVSVISVAVVLQAQCLALCTAIPCEETHAPSGAQAAALDEIAAAPCHGSPQGETSDDHGAETDCASPHDVEGQKVAAAGLDLHVNAAVLPIAVGGKAAAAGWIDSAAKPPIASSVLRSIQVTVLLM